jgi:hypothetical protein
METKVLFLNTWLDCPIVIQKRHESIQQKIRESRIHFFYKLKEEEKDCTQERIKFLYLIWVQSNRSNIKLLCSEKVL